MCRFKHRMSTMTNIVIAAFALLIITERDALAYADPGSGALIWQMVAASLFGGMFYFRKLLDKVLSLKRKGGEEGAEHRHKEP